MEFWNAAEQAYHAVTWGDAEPAESVGETVGELCELRIGEIPPGAVAPQPPQRRQSQRGRSA